MIKDTRANKIFMLIVLLVLFILIAGNKTSSNKKASFDNLDIEESLNVIVTSDINIWVDDSLKTAKIVYNGKDKDNLIVESSNGVTTIKEKDTKFFIFTINFEGSSSNLAIYLPTKDINKIDISTVSGDINTYDAITGEQLKFKTVSGSINLLDVSSNSSLRINSVSGTIDTKDLKAADATITSVSGDINLSSIDFTNGTIDTVSGDIDVTKARIEDKLKVDNNSGNIDFYLEDKDSSIKASTVSGEIEINDKDINSKNYQIGSDNNFIFKTISGDLDINF